MKKLIIIMLVAMVPFSTIAQKRSYKESDVSNQRMKKDAIVTKADYEFMVIHGMSPSSHSDKVKIAFDCILKSTPSSKDLAKEFSLYKSPTMVSAVNLVAKYGWQFVNATVTDHEGMMKHSYYMIRKK